MPRLVGGFHIVYRGLRGENGLNSIFDYSKYSEPVSDVAKDDVAKKTANVEEGGGNMRPLRIVAH